MEQTPNKQDTAFAYKTTIKNTYRLPESWIKRLEPPDKLVHNPHYPSRPSALYLRARVEAFIEAHQAEYDALLQQQAIRSQRAGAVADAARRRLQEWAANVEIEISPLPESKRQLEEQMVKRHESFHGLVYGTEAPPFTLSQNALLAYVRHTFTNYDQLLNEIEGKVGIVDAYTTLKARVNQLIEQRLTEQYGAVACVEKQEAH